LGQLEEEASNSTLVSFVIVQKKKIVQDKPNPLTSELLKNAAGGQRRLYETKKKNESGESAFIVKGRIVVYSELSITIGRLF